MAQLKVYGTGELMRQFEALEKNAEPAAKAAIYEGAKILADKAKSNLKSVLSGESTGEMESTFGIAPIGSSEDSINTRVGFDDYDSSRTPNPLKANVLENGTADGRQKKRPFMRPAINSTRYKIKKQMAETFDKELAKIVKG